MTTRTSRTAPLSSHTSRLQSRTARSLIASLIGSVVGVFFLTLAYHDTLYTLIGIAAGFRQVVVNAGAPIALRAVPLRFARVISSGTG